MNRRLFALNTFALVALSACDSGRKRDRGGADFRDIIDRADAALADRQYQLALDRADAALAFADEPMLLAWAHRSAGYALAHMDRHREAVIRFTQSIEADPNFHPHVYESRARAYDAIRRPELAAADRKTAAAMPQP